MATEPVLIAVALAIGYVVVGAATAGLARRRGWHNHLDDGRPGLTAEGGDVLSGVIWPFALPVALIGMALGPMTRMLFRWASGGESLDRAQSDRPRTPRPLKPPPPEPPPSKRPSRRMDTP